MVFCSGPYLEKKVSVMKRIALLVSSLLFTACPPPTISFNYAALPNPNASPYKVRSGDVLNVRVLKNEGTTGSYTVRPDGFISMPLGGEIKVRGLDTSQVRGKLITQLKRFITDAQDVVSVSLERVRGITYSVIGEVNRAGVFDNTRYVTILEALAAAGGLNVYAIPHGIYVLRTTAQGQTRIPFSYKATVKNPAGNRNFYLLPGDVVVVP